MKRSNRERSRFHAWCLWGAVCVAGCKSVDPLVSETIPKPTRSAANDVARAAARHDPSSDATTSAVAERPTGRKLEQDGSVVPTPTVTPASLQLETVGRALAGSEDSKGIRFEFSPLQNPKPRVYHSAGGHIYVSSGLLERVSGTDELAGVLAIEMAEYLCEKRQSEPSDAPGMKVGDRSTEELSAAFAAKAPDPREVDRIATGILRDAGYSSVEVPKVRDQLEKWYLVSRPPEDKPSLGRLLAN